MKSISFLLGEKRKTEEEREKEILEWAEQHKYIIAGECPLCANVLIRKSGTRGFFAGCVGFPMCKYTKDYKEPIVHS